MVTVMMVDLGLSTSPAGWAPTAPTALFQMLFNRRFVAILVHTRRIASATMEVQIQNTPYVHGVLTVQIVVHAPSIRRHRLRPCPQPFAILQTMEMVLKTRLCSHLHLQSMLLSLEP